ERFATAQEFLLALDGGGSRTASQPMAAVRPSVADRVRSAWHFLVRRAQEAGVPMPRAFVGLGLGLLVTLVGLLVLYRRTEAPKPSPPAVTTDLLRAEALLSHGELEGARAALTQLLSKHPDVARVYY